MARHRLDVVVDPDVVVAELFCESRDLHPSCPRRRRGHPRVLELPSLWHEDAESQAAQVVSDHDANSHHWSSHIIGRRYFR